MIAKINNIETKRAIQRINKNRRWFFKGINNIDKPLFMLTPKTKKKMLNTSNQR